MHLAPVTAEPDDIALATPAQRLDFLREARASLLSGVLPCGRALTEQGRDLIAAYVAELAQSLRPRVVASVGRH